MPHTVGALKWTRFAVPYSVGAASSRDPVRVVFSSPVTVPIVEAEVGRGTAPAICR